MFSNLFGQQSNEGITNGDFLEVSNIKQIHSVLKRAYINAEQLDEQSILIKINSLQVICTLEGKRIALMLNLIVDPSSMTLNNAISYCNQFNGDYQFVRSLAWVNDDNRVVISILVDLVFDRGIYIPEFIYQINHFARIALTVTNQFEGKL